MNVRPVTEARDLEAFHALPHRLYAGDAAWVAPLTSREAWRLDARKNPFFKKATRELFVAERGGQVVGRIVAVHDQRNADGTGVLGFFECENDDLTARALFDAGCAWLKARGARRCLGPMNLSFNDEFGVIVEGHDRRTPLMTAHTARWYPGLFERAGFKPERETLAFERMLVGPDGAPTPPPPGLVEAAREATLRTDLVVRHVVRANWSAEVLRTHQVMNASFEGLDTFEPIGLEEFQAVARQLEDILVPELMLLAESAGQPVGFAFLFPDMNEVLARLDGRLFPFGWAKALWAKRHITTASFKLAGVVPAWRRSGLAARMALEASQAAQRAGFKRMEMSMVNATNTRMCDFIALQGASPYLRFRLYERALS